MKTILIIEDDIVFSRSISNWLVKKGMKTECVATLANARKAIGQKEFDLILADLRLPDGNSTSLLKWMNEKYYSIPFLIMTNYGQVENAVTTMQLGAINYLCKPVQPDNLLALITEILDKNDNEQEFYRGESPKAHEMYRLIEMIACADISVLLRGASGTGKGTLQPRYMPGAIGRTSRIWLSTAGPFPMSLPPPSFSVIRREPLPVRKATRSDCSVPLTEGHCFWTR